MEEVGDIKFNIAARLAARPEGRQPVIENCEI
jgi:hypothetical protein